LKLSGSPEYVHVPDSSDWDFGTGDWVVDTFVNFSSLPANYIPIYERYVDINNWFSCFMYSDSVRIDIRFYCTVGGVIKGYYQSADIAVNASQWYHVAWVRNGSSFYIFLDGISKTLTVNTPIGTNDLDFVGASTARIGYSQLNSVYLLGFIDEFRVSKGTSRGWTSNFTVSNYQYPTQVLWV
jgi:hypothetical protein